MTKWTNINTAGSGLNPFQMTQFAGALWFQGSSETKGDELFKLGADGSVTLWTDINPGTRMPSGVAALWQKLRGGRSAQLPLPAA